MQGTFDYNRLPGGPTTPCLTFLESSRRSRVKDTVSQKSITLDAS